MKLGNVLWVALLIGFVAFVGWRTLRPAAATPSVFQDGSASLTLTQALERSKTEGKPVLAVATADWCPPCQALKRGALSDERVVAYVESNMIPVYLDVDKSPDDARMLGVSMIPASFVLADGAVAGRTSGNLGAGEYLAWLESSVQTGG